MKATNNEINNTEMKFSGTPHTWDNKQVWDGQHALQDDYMFNNNTVCKTSINEVLEWDTATV
jgi:hypothetical protein